MKDKKTDLILNMDEKIYLAVAKESTEKFAFVFTLACLRQGKTTSYDLNATREVHAFRNHDTAELYHAAIEKIIEKNTEDKNKAAFFVFNEKMIERFCENSR